MSNIIVIEDSKVYPDIQFKYDNLIRFTANFKQSGKILAIEVDIVFCWAVEDNSIAEVDPYFSAEFDLIKQEFDIYTKDNGFCFINERSVKYYCSLISDLFNYCCELSKKYEQGFG